GRAEFVSVRGQLVSEKGEGWKRERGRDDPLPGHSASAGDLTHDRVAEPERKGARRHVREQLVRATLGRFDIRWHGMVHGAFPSRRAAMRTLSAALARCRCVFTVPYGIPRASATS